MELCYQEQRPEPALAAQVECFWRLEAAGHVEGFRVLPDGCVDILFHSAPGRAPVLQLVGTMTRYQCFSLPAGSELAGVRVRPGAAVTTLQIMPREITDTALPLEDVWGAPGRRLRERLSNTRDNSRRLALLAEAVRPASGTAICKACRWIEWREGRVNMDELARRAGASTRHFRRLCLAETGLSPKLLCRALRLQGALRRLRAGGSCAAVALACSYFDQAHMIRDFRDLAGATPRQCLAEMDGRFLQS